MGGGISYVSSRLIVPEKSNGKQKIDDLEVAKDIEHMQEVMQCAPLQKEYCRFLQTKGKCFLLFSFRDLESLKQPEVYMTMVDGKIPTGDILLPVYDIAKIDDTEVRFSLRQVTYYLEQIIKMHTVISLNHWCEALNKAQDILIIDLLHEFRIFMNISSYELIKMAASSDTECTPPTVTTVPADTLHCQL